ncbi:hypothetical protein B5X24_HaOG213053 [Helicoverpa armigera]|nr:hypothetical protein B5X24_HaOG213053 [Helicoverpa armigera]
MSSQHGCRRRCKSILCCVVHFMLRANLYKLCLDDFVQTYLVAYLLVNNAAGQLYCSACDRVFKSKLGLASHIRAHARR